MFAFTPVKPSRDLYWDYDSFGSGPVPLNLTEVCEEANHIIDNASFDYDDPSDLRDFCDDLWEKFCATDQVGEVRALWASDDPDETMDAIIAQNLPAFRELAK